MVLKMKVINHPIAIHLRHVTEVPIDTPNHNSTDYLFHQSSQHRDNLKPDRSQIMFVRTLAGSLQTIE